MKCKERKKKTKEIKRTVYGLESELLTCQLGFSSVSLEIHMQFVIETIGHGF